MRGGAPTDDKPRCAESAGGVTHNANGLGAFFVPLEVAARQWCAVPVGRSSVAGATFMGATRFQWVTHEINRSAS